MKRKEIKLWALKTATIFQFFHTFVTSNDVIGDPIGGIVFKLKTMLHQKEITCENLCSGMFICV